MKTDSQLQQDVIAELAWQPLMKVAEIGVTAKDGVITLTGTVDSYAKKTEAEDAAKKVAGVSVVVEQIEIKFHHSWAKKDDNEIAIEIVNALKANWQIPKDKVKVKVENGWVTLAGEVLWNYESDAAKNAIKNPSGVTGVSNNIHFKTAIEDVVEKATIESALLHNWFVNDTDIRVDVSGHNVTLTGTVRSWHQKDEASETAWKAPGVWNVENDIHVKHDYSMVD